jgi:2-succinyl-5-enolpyruvyl-6-hydroxy-3-cyclohexene-1-carboxylate synthase
LNLPFREPLVGSILDLPPVDDSFLDAGSLLDDEVWFMTRLSMDDLGAMLDHGRGVIVAGAGVDDPDSVERLAAALGWPVLADPRSGCRHLPMAVCAFDPLLRESAFAAAHLPAAVLHLGEPPASKVLGQWLMSLGAVHVQVHAQGRTIDPLGIITERVYGPVSTVCDAIAPAMGASVESSWCTSWLEAAASAEAALAKALVGEPVLTEPGVARALSTFDGRLVVSSSMPVRDVEWFGAPSATVVHSNRGANGIDGVIATGIGVAIGSGEPTVVLLGDVAMCHDQSSLTSLAARQLPLTIVVTDNDGGGIFSFLSQRSQLSAERFEQLFGTPHGTDLVALARAHGLGARTVSSRDELLQAVADREASVVRVESNRDSNVAVHDALHAAVAAAIRGE